MALYAALCLFVFLVLPANSQDQEIQNITVLEGQPIILNCTVNASGTSVIEWQNPRGHVIFFDQMRGLKDARYKLVNFSSTMLIVSLVNTTVEDGGTYTCLHYGNQIRSKQVLLGVLAPPTHPVLSMTKNELQGQENNVFTCITTGSKPKPQISWLINNHVKLQVHTFHERENNGLKFTTTSTLKIIGHYNELRVDCLVQHRSLTDILRASLQFDRSSKKWQKGIHTNSTDVEKDKKISSEISSSTVYDPLRRTESNTQPTNEISTISRPESMTEISEIVIQKRSNQNIPTNNYSYIVTSTEDPQILTNESETSLNSNSTTNEELPVTARDQSTLQTKANPQISFNSNSTENNTIPIEQHEITVTSTEESIIKNTSAEIDHSESTPTNITESNTINKRDDPNYQIKWNSALILILVTFLICSLIIIIQLFVLKVRKEHMKWKKQNDDSEQTVESNRSNKSSNEENHNTKYYKCRESETKTEVAGETQQVRQHSWRKESESTFQIYDPSSVLTNEENVRQESNNREQMFLPYTEQNLVTQYAVRINSEEHLEQQYSNDIYEDHLNTLGKESIV